MWAAEGWSLTGRTGRKPGPNFEAVLTFSFLIVRGVWLPRSCSVRRNLFGWMGQVGERVQAFAAIWAGLIEEGFACEQLSREDLNGFGVG